MVLAIALPLHRSFVDITLGPVYTLPTIFLSLPAPFPDPYDKPYLCKLQG